MPYLIQYCTNLFIVDLHVGSKQSIASAILPGLFVHQHEEVVKRAGYQTIHIRFRFVSLHKLKETEAIVKKISETELKGKSMKFSLSSERKNRNPPKSTCEPSLISRYYSNYDLN